MPGNRNDCKTWAPSGTKDAVGRTTVIADGDYQGTGLVIPHPPRTRPGCGSKESRVGAVEPKARVTTQAQEFGHGHRTTAGRHQILAGLRRPQPWEARQSLPTVQHGDFVTPAVPPQALIEFVEPSGENPGQPCRVAGAQGFPAKGIGGEVEDLARSAGPTRLTGAAPVEGEDAAQHIVRDHETCTCRPCAIERRGHRVDFGQAGQSFDVRTTRASEDPQPSAVHEQTAAVQYDPAQI